MSRRPGRAPPPSHLIALGSKSKGDDNKGSSSGDRKLSLSGKSSTGVSLPKKPKIVGPQTYTALGRPSEIERRGSPTVQHYYYEEIAKDVEPHELVDSVLDAEEASDDEKIEALLCGAVKYLKMNRAKPDPGEYLGLMYLAKSKPTRFQSEVVVEAFASLLKRDVSISFKAKGNPLVSVLCCNVLLTVFLDEENWPESFVKVYLDDSLGERVWVDRPDCKAFVENIQSAFNTKMPRITSDTFKTETSSASPSPVPFGDDEDSKAEDYIKFLTPKDEEDISGLVAPRYNYQLVSIQTYVLDTLRDHLTRRQSLDGGSRSLLRTMTATCGYTETRTIASQRLEMWLQNPKLTKHAQDLLMACCMNCDQHSQPDVEVMYQLSKVRLKTKNLSSHYVVCMRELLSQHPENMRTLMTHTIYNELSNSRNPNNMSLLSTMFAHSSDGAAKILAEIFQDLLAHKDDYLRAVRALFREIVRSVRQDMKFPEFALGLMTERTEIKFRDMDSTLKERLLMALTDVICLTSLIGVSPGVREAASAVARGDERDLETLRSFQRNTAFIQRDAVWWLHTVVPKMFDVKPKEYIHCLKKVLFMESADHYHKVDNWPPEGDRGILLRLVSEVPVMEDTLMRVLVIGLTKELHIGAADAIDIADQLVRRAAMLNADDMSVLKVERLELIDALFNLTTYRHPENIALPKGYTPPSLAISNLYWKAWTILLTICAFNPSTFGLAAWDNYPTLKCLMEMAMTNNYRFPPPTMATDDAAVEEIRAKERQISELERQEILEFEGYLAAATNKMVITEVNSLLISQLTSRSPMSVARKPPPAVVDKIKHLNQTVKLGQMMCKSRNPDFLLIIIEGQGASQSMPWLAELVESSEGSLDVLPVQCLCEFLLHDASNDGTTIFDDDDASREERQKKLQKQRKQEQLLVRLKRLLRSDDCDSRTIQEVLGYFLNRLKSSQKSSRQLAVKGLSMVLSRTDTDMDTDETPGVVAVPSQRWLLEDLPSIPQFGSVLQQSCITLRQACMVETEIDLVSSYICFLSQNTSHMPLAELDELALDMAQMIVDRATLINQLLPMATTSKDDSRPHAVLGAMVDLFFNYLTNAKQPQKEGISWSNMQDQIMLQWQDGDSATMNILVVHGMIILLTYGKPNVESSFDELLEAWFPEEGNSPSAYLVETSEEALLLPDWLKLRMIRSTMDRLVDAALQDLEASQLLLFVQSFGIPVSSMSKLLEYLDKAVDIDSAAMSEVVVDKMYMAQLVEVQHLRGALGGEKFKAMLLEGSEDMDKDMEVDHLPGARRTRRTTSQLTRTAEIPSICHKDIRQIQDMLQQIFESGGSNLTARERQEMFRVMQKTLALEDISTTLIQSFKVLIKDKSKPEFVEGLKRNLHLSCPLLRLLIAKKGKHKSMVQLMEILQKNLEDSKSALLNLVQSYLTGVKGHEIKGSNIVNQLQDMQLSPPETLGKVVTEGLTNQHTEKAVNMLMRDSLNQDSTTEFVQKSASVLQQQSSPMLTSTAGVIVDWLELLDAEVISKCPQIQQQLVFAKQVLQESGEDPKDRRKSCQPYLLALLTHQAHWGSIHGCIDVILNRDEQFSGLNPTPVLDFLYACLHVPKIWQGRDKKIPKNYVPEDVLHLTPEQIIKVVKYVIKEAEGHVKVEDQEGKATEDKLTDGARAVITQRVQLLLECCCYRTNLEQAVVDYLLDRVKKNCPDSSLCRHLVLEVYLHMPHVLSMSTIATLTDAGSTQKSNSQLDTITHRILSALGKAQHGKTADNRMYDANLACRKLAAEHPLLVLRQLPMMAAILRGRSQYTFGEMKHRNHILLYTHVLGILELLQPHVFRAEYSADLAQTLEAFFVLIKAHGLETKQLAVVVTKFVRLVHNYMTADPVRAGLNLHQFLPVLNNLTTQYPDLPLLRSVLAGLTLPRQDAPLETQETPEEGCNYGNPRPDSPWNVSQLTPFLNRIAKGSSSDDVEDVLKDLDETSKRKVDILQHFMSDLKRLTKDPMENIRSTAYLLIMRYIRQTPGAAEDFVPTFFQCLDHPDQSVVSSALKHLAEFVLLAQDRAKGLLQKAFTVGVLSKAETGSFIIDSIQLLNMETMLV